MNRCGPTVNPKTYTASPVVVDEDGNVYYNVVQIAAGSPDFYTNDVVGSWLVKVQPDGEIHKVSYSTLLSQATIKGDRVPAGTDPCKVAFADSQLPWPPSPTAVPGTTTCGSQPAGLNVAPAIG